MLRDMEKTAAQIVGKIPSGYQLSSKEMYELMDKALQGGANGTCKALIMAFRYGFVLGTRAARKAALGK